MSLVLSSYPVDDTAAAENATTTTDSSLTYTVPLSPISDFESVHLQVPASLDFARLPESIDEIIGTGIPARANYAAPQTVVQKTDEECVSMKSVDLDTDFLSDSTPDSRPKTESRKRVFACSYQDCGKAFSKKWNLQAHLRLHTGEKPFTCRIGCGEKYMWMSSLKSHEKRKCKLLPDSARIRKKLRPRPTKAAMQRFAPPQHPLPEPYKASPSLSFSSTVSEPGPKNFAYQKDTQMAVRPTQYCDLGSVFPSVDQQLPHIDMPEQFGFNFLIRNAEPVELRRQAIVMELETILSSSQ